MDLSRCRRSAGYALLIIAIAITQPSCVTAAITDLSVAWLWTDGTQIPEGTRFSSVVLNVTNEGKLPIRLEFVGLRFEWMKKDVYLYGGGSEKEYMLSPGQSIAYSIPFGIPENITLGGYMCWAGIVYHIREDSTWRRVEVAHLSPSNLEITPVAVITITSTRTVSTGEEDWTVDFALLIAFTAVGLALLATFRSARKVKQPSGDQSADIAKEA